MATYKYLGGLPKGSAGDDISATVEGPLLLLQQRNQRRGWIFGLPLESIVSVMNNDIRLPIRFGYREHRLVITADLGGIRTEVVLGGGQQALDRLRKAILSVASLQQEQLFVENANASLLLVDDHLRVSSRSWLGQSGNARNLALTNIASLQFNPGGFAFGGSLTIMLKDAGQQPNPSPIRPMATGRIQETCRGNLPKNRHRFMKVQPPANYLPMRYAVVFEKAGAGWSAYVPDLPGCVAAGTTRLETERLIREAVTPHMASLREDNEPVPQPRTWTKRVAV